MWSRQHTERGDALRMVRRSKPGHLATPVVAHQVERWRLKRVGDIEYICHQSILSISRDRRRSHALRVSPLIRSNCMKAGLGKRWQEVSPGMPGLRESVQGKYQRPLIGPGGTRCERAFPGGDHDVATLHGVAHFPYFMRQKCAGPRVWRVENSKTPRAARSRGWAGSPDKGLVRPALVLDGHLLRCPPSGTSATSIRKAVPSQSLRAGWPSGWSDRVRPTTPGSESQRCPVWQR